MFCSRKGNGIPITCTAICQKWTGRPTNLAGSKNPLTLGMGSVNGGKMLIDKLNQILNSEDESSVSYVISLFIKKNLKEIPELSINYIACSCHTSKSQISKYIKSLGYRTMKEFKTECMDNVSGFERTNITLFSLQKNTIEQFTDFTKDLICELYYAMEAIDEKKLCALLQDLQKSKRVFVYGHGHASTLCSYVQNELSTKGKETVICDVDFAKKYVFYESDILIIISINGNTFHFEKGVIQNILNCSVNTWLISCKKNIDFSEKFLYIPTIKEKYNAIILRHMIDFILLH